MVAISLYRGNLHRVPDVPRRWLMPSPTISLKDFKALLNRRNDSLSRLRSSSSTTTTTTSSNPNPNSNQNNETPKDDVSPQLPPSNPNNNIVKDDLDGQDSPPKEADKDPDTMDEDSNLQALQVAEKPPDPEKPAAETTDDKVNVLNDKEKRKRDVEDKLEVLNAKKHKLVQVLKQILNVEEGLKSRNSMAIRPSVALQADAMNDTGSITRHAAHRMGSEGNLGGDMEGGEADDASNQNMHSRHMLRMSSTSPSPSSESPLRRPTFIQHNVMQVPLPSRATLGATSSPSPSRFAPTGHQGHPGNLPTVSVSGTNYVPSSPSPAASGGTSVFRDGRQPSPWN